MRIIRQPPDRCRASHRLVAAHPVATRIVWALTLGVAFSACKTETDRSSQRVTSYEKSDKPPASDSKATQVKRTHKRKSESQKPQPVAESLAKDAGPAGHLKEQVERLDKAAVEQARELEKLSGESP